MRRIMEDIVSRRIAITEGPSENLRRRFAQLQITERHWRRAAKRHLRGIVGDLPLFDSAWIDACVCDRLLTVWQADVLNSNNPEAFLIESTIIDRIIDVTSGGTLFEGRRAPSKRLREPHHLVEVLSLDASRHTDEDFRTHLERLIEFGRKTGDTGTIQWPCEYFRNIALADSVGDAIVFRHVAGVTLKELLIRRGRLTETITRSVASQVLAATEQLESAGLVHGDIRAETVRLAENGTVSLLRCGLRPALEPAVQYRESLHPRAYTAIAPERIGTNAAASPRSDRYAIGCLLWEMLAGRPITPHGSALGCLRAHHTGDLPDLGEFAPETSKEFLQFIRLLLSSTPNDRPRAISVESQKLMRRQVTTPVNAAKLVRTRKPARTTSVTNRAMTLAASVLLTVGIWLSWPTIQSAMVARGTDVAPLPIQASTTAPAVPTSVPKVPDATGNLQLPPGEFPASQIVWSGALTITGADDGTTTIIADAPWQVFADTVTLERVTLTGNPSTESLFDAHSQNVVVRNCRLLANGRSSAIRWTALDSSDQTGRNIVVEQTRFDGNGTTIELTSDPRTVALRDVVMTGFDSVASLERWTRSPARMVLDHCTARDINTLIRCEAGEITSAQRLAVTLRSSLFEPTGPTMVRTGDVNPNEVLLRFPIETTTCISTRAWPIVAIGPRDFIEVGQLTFAGPSDGSDRNSILRAADVPLPVDTWPGARRFASVSSTADRPDPNTVTAETSSERTKLER